LSSFSHARRRSTYVSTLGSNSIEGSPEDEPADARAVAEDANARSGTSARAEREEHHAGHPAVVNSRTARRSIALARGRTAAARRLGATSSGASGDASHERGTAKAIARDAGRSKGLRGVAWVSPHRGHDRGARGSGAAPGRKVFLRPPPSESAKKKTRTRQTFSQKFMTQ
jgi:hypothetical protein